jgi:hypothetical protein
MDNWTSSQCMARYLRWLDMKEKCLCSQLSDYQYLWDRYYDWNSDCLIYCQRNRFGIIRLMVYYCGFGATFNSSISLSVKPACCLPCKQLQPSFSRELTVQKCCDIFFACRYLFPWLVLVRIADSFLSVANCGSFSTPHSRDIRPCSHSPGALKTNPPLATDSIICLQGSGVASGSDSSAVRPVCFSKCCGLCGELPSSANTELHQLSLSGVFGAPSSGKPLTSGKLSNSVDGLHRLSFSEAFGAP